MSRTLRWLRKNRIRIVTSGVCARRQLDLERFRRFLLANDYVVVPDDAAADIVVVWGCAFNSHQEEDSLLAVREALRMAARVVVIEGIAVTRRNDLQQLGVQFGDILEHGDTKKLDAVFGRRVSFTETALANAYYRDVSAGRPSGVWHVQTSWGCADECSYCGDRTVVGALRSRPLPDILADIDRGGSQGQRDFELLGDDVGAYGIDAGLTVFDLLEAVSNLTCVRTFRIQELNIRHLMQNLVRLERILSQGKVQSMGVGMQSGCDRILRLMRRGYTRREIIDLSGVLHRTNIRAHYHLLAGFPSETRDEFRESLDVLGETHFNSCSVFGYQARPYAPAFHMAGAHPWSEVEWRLDFAAGRFAGFAVKRLPDKVQIVRR